MIKKFHLEHWHTIAFFLNIYDALAVTLSYLAALWLRFDLQFSKIPSEYFNGWKQFAPIYAAFCLLLFWKLRLYRTIWRYASYNELLRTLVASVISFVFHTVGITVLFKRMPISYYLMGPIIQFLLVIGIRFSYRFVLLERSRKVKAKNAKNVMLIGAGESGQIILRDIMKAKETTDQVKCIIDDNPNKWGRYMDGVPVIGGRDQILEAVERYEIDKIYVAIPSATAKQRRDILNICKETDCELKNLPGIYQLVNGELTVSSMRSVSVEDLLGREPIKVNNEEIFQSLAGKVILVTGGGGSIGSELCRQIAAHHPRQLIIFDVYENNAYDIQQELVRNYPDLNLKTEIGSVRDSRRMDMLFRLYRPEIVYHAAAHKHVPLMEASPNEAIKNNVIGTYKTAYAAIKYGTKRFVLISTDKAVNPTNIMGASKRLCEMVIQIMDKVCREGKEDILPLVHAHTDIIPAEMTDLARKKGDLSEDYFPLDVADNFSKKGDRVKTEFVAVRFGNVLGSNGSVIPLFKKQIAAGGPVTVTHPDIIRYFMTIPEAVGLVLQAGTYAKGGEIFVLDMGEPVKIDTLARNLIRLSGLRPEEDIKIVYTGLRPGEKLYEEKLMAEEGLEKTPNEMIHVGKPLNLNTEEFLIQLERLAVASYNNSSRIREMVSQMVPTYVVDKHTKKTQ